MTRPNHLAWHETLELHELVVFQTVALKKLKMAVKDISCPALKALYLAGIKSCEKNLKELLEFYPAAPKTAGGQRGEEECSFYAGNLLALVKTTVRNYAIAITETATPSLRACFVNHLNAAITLHAKVFEYMFERGYYPSYDLEKLLQNDIKIAHSALNKPF